MGNWISKHFGSGDKNNNEQQQQQTSQEDERKELISGGYRYIGPTKLLGDDRLRWSCERSELKGDVARCYVFAYEDLNGVYCLKLSDKHRHPPNPKYELNKECKKKVNLMHYYRGTDEKLPDIPEEEDDDDLFNQDEKQQ